MNRLQSILRALLRLPRDAPWKHPTPAAKDLDRATERRVRRAIERRL